MTLKYLKKNKTKSLYVFSSCKHFIPQSWVSSQGSFPSGDDALRKTAAQCLSLQCPGSCFFYGSHTRCLLQAWHWEAPARQTGLLLRGFCFPHPAGGGPGGNNALFHGRAGGFVATSREKRRSCERLFWKWKEICSQREGAEPVPACARHSLHLGLWMVSTLTGAQPSLGLEYWAAPALSRTRRPSPPYTSLLPHLLLRGPGTFPWPSLWGCLPGPPGEDAPLSMVSIVSSDDFILWITTLQHLLCKTLTHPHPNWNQLPSWEARWHSACLLGSCHILWCYFGVAWSFIGIPYSTALWRSCIFPKLKVQRSWAVRIWLALYSRKLFKIFLF